MQIEYSKFNDNFSKIIENIKSLETGLQKAYRRWNSIYIFLKSVT